MSKLKNLSAEYFSNHLSKAIGLVLVWRGVWYILDEIDYIFFDGYSGWTGLLGVIIGLAILYAPDQDLKELDKL